MQHGKINVNLLVIFAKKTRERTNGMIVTINHMVYRIQPERIEVSCFTYKFCFIWHPHMDNIFKKIEQNIFIYILKIEVFKLEHSNIAFHFMIKLLA